MQADVEQHLEKMLDCPHANFYSSLASWTSKIFITEKKDCLYSISRWLTTSEFIFSTKVSSISKERKNLLEPINTYVCGLFIWRNLQIHNTGCNKSKCILINCLDTLYGYKTEYYTLIILWYKIKTYLLETCAALC